MALFNTNALFLAALLFRLILEDQQQDLMAHVHVCVLTPSLERKDLKAEFWAQGQKAGGVITLKQASCNHGLQDKWTGNL